MQLQLKLNQFCFLSVNSIMQYTGCTISFSSNNVASESINGITMITSQSQTEELLPKYSLVQSMRVKGVNKWDAKRHKKMITVFMKSAIV